jgi:hypothetical protein
MGEKRAYLINAFLNAWSGGADRANVHACVEYLFCSTGDGDQQ